MWRKRNRPAELCKRHFAGSKRMVSHPAWIGSGATWKYSEYATHFRVSHHGSEVAACAWLSPGVTRS